MDYQNIYYIKKILNFEIEPRKKSNKKKCCFSKLKKKIILVFFSIAQKQKKIMHCPLNTMITIKEKKLNLNTKLFEKMKIFNTSISHFRVFSERKICNTTRKKKKEKYEDRFLKCKYRKSGLEYNTYKKKKEDYSMRAFKL